ncbi:MAG TPA: hypothetical protein VGL94_11140 [Ktedonobacteraceae bacterium]|jgi:hypothetical protein
MLSEQSVLGTREVVAITCYIAIHLGLHILTQGENAIIHEHLTHDVTDVVMAKQGFSLATPLPLNFLGHRTFMCGESSQIDCGRTVYAQNRFINSEADIFEGTADPRCDGLA